MISWCKDTKKDIDYTVFRVFFYFFRLKNNKNR